MLAGFCGRDGHFSVQVVGRRYIHNIHLRILDHLTPVRRPAGKTKLRGALCHGLVIYVRDDFKNGPTWLVAKNQRYIFKGHGMGFPHEPRADQANPYVFHGFVPLALDAVATPTSLQYKSMDRRAIGKTLNIEVISKTVKPYRPTLFR